jgi:hypothetical protein
MKSTPDLDGYLRGFFSTKFNGAPLKAELANTSIIHPKNPGSNLSKDKI